MPCSRRWCRCSMSARTGPGLRSDVCDLASLVSQFTGDDAFRQRLVLHGDWPRRWATTWMFDGGQVVWPVRDLGSVPVLDSRPVRRFTWRPRQRHRPGLEPLVSTGRQHGFESLEERDLLRALDFVRVREVLPQPFRLDFEHTGGRSAHVPDFLALMPDGGWLFDVRPAPLVQDEDALKFAATREVASAAGWHYTVVGGWRPHVLGVLDALLARRRPRKDPLGLQPQLLAAAAERPRSFAELVGSTEWPELARVEAVPLLWHRRLGVDLGSPLQDGSLVWLGQPAARGRS
ncbi:TnsA-like heteromeric transposase endonuclease subunit [Kitasatospora sp. NPDC059648]|uniref:TnsA-like heteromeric transposase endonuclease subunit n=1 Tax=Kitasatospora sp. NPDC059648 TaxID=3346894 RepID=UPI0036C45497